MALWPHTGYGCHSTTEFSLYHNKTNWVVLYTLLMEEVSKPSKEN